MAIIFPNVRRKGEKVKLPGRNGRNRREMAETSYAFMKDGPGHLVFNPYFDTLIIITSSLMKETTVDHLIIFIL